MTDTQMNNAPVPDAPNSPPGSPSASWPALPARDFCLIRHGETTANRDGIIAGRLDVALTPRGQAQADALAARQWPGPVAVFTSPLKRADETARRAFTAQPIAQEAGLRERNWGIFEGRPLAELPPRADTPPQGEAWPDMIARVHRTLCLCLAAAGDRLPVLVCHSGVIRATRLLIGHSDSGTRPDNAVPLIYRWHAERHEETPL